MIIEVKIPGAGESITEAAIGNWLIEDGSIVEKDQEIAEVETDKATLPLIAPESGKIKILAEPGKKINVGEIACLIDSDIKTDSKKTEKKEKPEKLRNETPNLSVAASTAEEHNQQPVIETSENAKDLKENKYESKEIKVTPLAQSIMEKHNLNIDDIISGLKRISKNEVELVINDNKTKTANNNLKPPDGDLSDRALERNPMSPLRRKLSKRLVAVKNETAMLTTFNEIDMSNLMELRKKYQAKFLERHKQKLGLMSFFTKACAKALIIFPKVNSYLDGEDILTPKYVDIAFAVQTEKGLMVPVLRNVNKLGIAGIEKLISELAEKAKSSKISLEEMTGGTFTITNGGVFGSMLSTPILNPPQSAILGMHNIVDRPVAINGNIEIRPVMYVALSYDHRIIDGKDSVSFLVKVKELIESPVKLLFEEEDPEKQLLEL